MALYAEIDSCSAEPEKLKEKKKELRAFEDRWMSHDGACKDLRFAYRDDEVNIRSLGFVFNKGQTDSWALHIVENPDEPTLELRQMTSFAQGVLATKGQGSTIELASLPEEIKAALNSEKLNSLLSGLIGIDGNVSIEKFDELNSRINANRNLDNRTVKQRQLDELIDVAQTYLSSSESLDEYINDIKARATNELDFFREDNFQRTLRQIVDYVDAEVEEHPEGITGAILHLTFEAIQLELKAFDKSIFREQAECNELMSQAKVLRERRTCVENIKVFTDKLNQLNTSSETFAAKQKFYHDGRTFLDKITAIAEADPVSLTLLGQWSELNRILPLCSHAVDAVSDFPDTIVGAVVAEFSFEDIFLGFQACVGETRTYAENIKAFTDKLNDLDKTSGRSADEQKFHQQGEKVLQDIKAIAEDDLNRPILSEWIELNRVITSCLLAVDNSKGMTKSAQLAQVEKLGQISQMALSQSSPLWKALGASLLAFKEDKIYELESRIIANRDLYNSDVKQLKLDELINAAKIYLPNDKALGDYIAVIKSRSIDELDFFQDDKFQDTLNDILDYVEVDVRQHPEDLAGDSCYLTFNAIQQELKALCTSEQVQRDDLMSQANVFRERRACVENIIAFTAKLKPFNVISGTSESDKQFYQQGKTVLENVKAIAKDNPDALTFSEWSELNQVLASCSLAIDEPKNAVNNAKLAQLSQTASGHSSSLWKSLGAALLVFTAIALVVAGVLGAIPTGGASLLLTVVGATTLAGTGALAIQQGTQSGLAASVSGFFKAAKNKANEDDVNVVEPGPQPKGG